MINSLYWSNSHLCRICSSIYWIYMPVSDSKFPVGYSPRITNYLPVGDSDFCLSRYYFFFISMQWRKHVILIISTCLTHLFISLLNLRASWWFKISSWFFAANFFLILYCPPCWHFFFCKTDIVDLNTVAEKITSMLKYLLLYPEINLQPLQLGLFYIRSPVSFAGYPVKLLNKLCKLRMSKLFSEPFHQVWNKSKIVTRNVGRFCWKLKLSTFCFWKKNLYSLFSRISGIRPSWISGIRRNYWPDISIRYNLTCNPLLLHLKTILEELVDGVHRDTVAGAVQLHGVDASLLPPFKETVNKFWV